MTKKCSGVPSSYAIQNGCYNCGHVHKITEWEEGTTYYCGKDESKRPLSGSVYMEESLFAEGVDFDTASKAWQKWSKKHYVEPWGKCDLWEKELS